MSAAMPPQLGEGVILILGDSEEVRKRPAVAGTTDSFLFQKECLHCLYTIPYSNASEKDVSHKDHHNKTFV